MKVQVLGVVKDGLSDTVTRTKCGSSDNPGTTQDNEIRCGYEIIHNVLKSNGFSSYSIVSLGIEDLF